MKERDTIHIFGQQNPGVDFGRFRLRFIIVKRNKSLDVEGCRLVFRLDLRT